jgi:hypothetical protein
MAAQSLQFATKVKKLSILTHSLTSLNFFHAAEHPRHPCAVNMLSCFTRKRNGCVRERDRERGRESHMVIFANLFRLKNLDLQF